MSPYFIRVYRLKALETRGFAWIFSVMNREVL